MCIFLLKKKAQGTQNIYQSIIHCFLSFTIFILISYHFETVIKVNPVALLNIVLNSHTTDLSD